VTRRILVVEDDASSRELLRDWLEGEDYEVVAADSLAAARAALAASAPDAVLLDVQLGGEDGLELVRGMRREPPLREVPVIAVTASVIPTHREKIFEAGCNALVSKPVNFRQLRGELDRWLRPA
jgi:CheY-like chemotaxis protein